jgi:hypothetical protein
LDERKHFQTGAFLLFFSLSNSDKTDAPLTRDIVHGKGAAIERGLKDKTPTRGV